MSTVQAQCAADEINPPGTDTGRVRYHLGAVRTGIAAGLHLEIVCIALVGGVPHVAFSNQDAPVPLRASLFVS